MRIMVRLPYELNDFLPKAVDEYQDVKYDE